MKSKLYISLFILIASFTWCNAQQITVKLGNTTISENEYFTITLTVNNGKLNTYSNFPDIIGFSKFTTISNASTSSDKVVKPLIITQQYLPLKVGKFKINDFSMNINGRIIPVLGSNINVLPVLNSTTLKSNDLTNDVKSPTFKFTDDQINSKEPFLTLISSKNLVYNGEGFIVSLLFCIPENTKTSLKFYELSEQLTSIIKKIKPENCIQETLILDSLQQITVNQNGKKFSYFKIYETVFYPINTNKIEFSQQTITMALKKPILQESSLKQNLVIFTSKPFVVEVKSLPPHPLKDLVPVGAFSLNESISTTNFKTGKSFNYIFKIIGTKNRQIPVPILKPTKHFEYYEPEVFKINETINNELIGTTSFNYFVIPNDPGIYDMKTYFNYVFFNTEKQKYDTLFSKIQIHVKGESKHNLGVSINIGDGFYDLINTENNFFINKSTKNVYILLAKVFIIILLLLLLVLFLRR